MQPFILVWYHSISLLSYNFLKIRKKKDIWVKFVFPYKENNGKTTARGGGEAREEAELTSFSLSFSLRLVNHKCISHWGLMSVLLLDVDQESSEARALTPRKGTSLGFALLGFVF